LDIKIYLIIKHKMNIEAHLIIRSYNNIIILSFKKKKLFFK